MKFANNVCINWTSHNICSKVCHHTKCIHLTMCEGLLVFCQVSLVPWPYHPPLPPTKALHLFFQSASLPSSSSSPSPSSSSLWSDPWVQSCAGSVLLGEPVPLPGFTAALGHHTEDSIKPKVVQMVLLQINVQIRTYVHSTFGMIPFVCVPPLTPSPLPLKVDRIASLVPHVQIVDEVAMGTCIILAHVYFSQLTHVSM